MRIGVDGWVGLLLLLLLLVVMRWCGSVVAGSGVDVGLAWVVVVVMRWVDGLSLDFDRHDG